MGMRQRLGLAAALIGDPRLLVLDEPANGLDPEGIRWLRGFLRHLASEGRTILVSSHLLQEIEQTVDDVVILANGKLVKEGTVGDLRGAATSLVRTTDADTLIGALRASNPWFWPGVAIGTALVDMAYYGNRPGQEPTDPEAIFLDMSQVLFHPLIAGLVLAGCSGGGGAAPSPTPTVDPGIPVRDLAVGDCIDSHGRPGISETVLVVGCGQEHDSEAYAEIVLDDGGFPGDEVVKDRAQGGCAADFVEFAGIGPGPFCGMMLADHGAEVIRIERPGARHLSSDAFTRSRRTIAIDMKQPDGIALARKLVASADGVFEGFRPGVMERLGLGPDLLRRTATHLRAHDRMGSGRGSCRERRT